jgi:hypothetical protein
VVAKRAFAPDREPGVMPSISVLSGGGGLGRGARAGGRLENLAAARAVGGAETRISRG